MKRFYILIWVSIILTMESCQIYHLLYKINTDSSLKVEKKYIVYENDTLSITYNFWAEKGVLSFAIFNKTDKPLYLDWKKSSYILNLQKLNFWEDETSVKISSISNSYLYNGYRNPVLPYQYVGQTNSTSSGLETRPERISFIAPKSFISNSKYILLNDRINFQDKIIIRKHDAIKYRAKDSITIYQKKYNELNSPLNFKVFLTFSTKENFDDSEFYVTNKFYLSEITELPNSEYFYSDINESANYFYFEYPQSQSMSKLYW